MPIVVVPKQVYEKLLKNPIWAKVDLQPGRGYYSPTGHHYLTRLVKQVAKATR